MKFLNCQTETSMKFNLTVNSAWIRDCFAIWITHEPKLSRAISPQPIFTSLIYVNCYIVVPLQHIGIWKRNIKHLYLFHKILTFQFTACGLPCKIFKEYPHYSNRTVTSFSFVFYGIVPSNYIILPKQTRKTHSPISFEISSGVNKSDQVFQIHQEQGEEDKICFHFSQL